jgi:hypothetical protein
MDVRADADHLEWHFGQLEDVPIASVTDGPLRED